MPRRQLANVFLGPLIAQKSWANVVNAGVYAWIEYGVWTFSFPHKCNRAIGLLLFPFTDKNECQGCLHEIAL